ncbi:site-specific integrase [Aliikangiella marina]|uniref:site-specific integrase n=1 Tax=Aliikangiella marina TaxID=1712262 RepID=UPI001AED643D|nr:site-specific integrase [Aliikangiella marina]
MSQSSKINQYIQAATRDNTRRSYQSAIEHYEVTWGGFLPATANNIAEYLADHAETLAFTTLKQRAAALARWHIDQGFPDPTKSSLVKKVLKGIRELHPVNPKQAKPLQLEPLSQIVDYLEQEIADNPLSLVSYRDKALVLLGFWRGFRSDELCRLNTEFINVAPNNGLELYLPRSKGDKQSVGRAYYAPALKHLCPVKAYQDWIGLAKIEAGPVFRAINRWGQVSDKALNPNSIVPLLRSLFKKASISMPEQYSSHSLRRGFASWASENGWSLKALMEYVGWQDPKSALRYIDNSIQKSQFIELM